MANKKTRMRESVSGFHFFELYKQCPRKFLIKYFARIVPKYTGVPLINGYAFHEGKATFYLTKSKKKSINQIKTILKQRRQEYQYDEDYETALYKLPILMKAWISQYGVSDFEDYKIIGVEKYIEVPIKGTKYKLTMRLDGIAEDEDKALWLLETKTSSSSKNLTKDALTLGDQITTYLLGMRKLYPGRIIAGAIGDIAYWHKTSKNLSNIDCFREDIFRTERDFAEYELSTASTMNDLNARITALKTGNYHYAALFPKSTHYCMAFFKKCEYHSVCREAIPLKGRVPFDGFIRDRNSKYRSIAGVTEV